MRGERRARGVSCGAGSSRGPGRRGGRAFSGWAGSGGGHAPGGGIRHNSQPSAGPTGRREPRRPPTRCDDAPLAVHLLSPPVARTACVTLLVAPVLASVNRRSRTVVAFSSSEPNGGIVVGGDGGYYGTVSSSSQVTGGPDLRVSADGTQVRRSTSCRSPRLRAVGGPAGRQSDGVLYGTTSLGPSAPSRARPNGVQHQDGRKDFRSFTKSHR